MFLSSDICHFCGRCQWLGCHRVVWLFHTETSYSRFPPTIVFRSNEVSHLLLLKYWQMYLRMSWLAITAKVHCQDELNLTQTLKHFSKNVTNRTYGKICYFLQVN